MLVPHFSWPCQDKFWKFATNAWTNKEVTGDNINELAEEAANQYLASLR